MSVRINSCEAQFNTEYTNLRDDEFGGSPRGRIRFTAEIISAIRRSVPANFVIGVRVSEAKVNDFHYQWPGGPAEAETIFGALAEAGASYIHVAGEGRGFRDSISDSHEPHTALVRRLTGLPAIANGGLDDPQLAKTVIRGGHADLIALGRAALATPDWPLRVASGTRTIPFDQAMISPKASIQNTGAWFNEHRNTKQPVDL